MSNVLDNNQGFETEKGYIWSMLGTAIGFANLLGFSSQCYKNGGGAFLLPFFAALFILGIPMLMLEGILGQKTQKPLTTLYREYGPRHSSFFAWLSLFVVGTIGAFYAVLTAWSVAYSFFSLFQCIPEDTRHFFSHDFLKTTSQLSDFGAFSPSLVLANLVVIAFTWFVLSKDIRQGIEKWCSAFLPLLTGMIFIFLAIIISLPGSLDGLYHYLVPDFNKLADWTLWRDVFGQLFFSLSLGIGIVVGYSRHTQKSTNMRQAMTKVALADFFISFLCGFVIFGSIGYLAFQQQIPFHEIVAKASTFEIGYVIFPVILKTFPPFIAPICGFLFFFSVFIAGITGLFSIIESIVGNLEFEFALSRPKAVFRTMLAIGSLSFIFTMGNGTLIFDALEPMLLGNTMLLAGIVQIVVFIYYAKAFTEDRVWLKADNSKNLYFYFLKYISLFVLVLCLFFSLKIEFSMPFSQAHALRWTWLALVCFFSFILSQRQPKPLT